jgi:hypothetical protein
MQFTPLAQVAVVASIVLHKQQAQEQMAVGLLVAVVVVVLLITHINRVQAEQAATALSSLQLTSDEYYY